MDFEPSARSQSFLERIKRFMADEIEPVERQVLTEMAAQDANGD